ncbi:MAG: DUF530 family protein [Candidatus Micrarchaeia archaeon]|jgi:Zn-finger domain-containing protein
MVELSSSEPAIAQANRFLDSLREPRTEAEAAANVAELERIKEEMSVRGFSTPFASISSAAKNEDLDEHEIRELKKQVRKMKELANSKKFTLNRVIVALSANRIAQRLLSRNRTEILSALPLTGNYIVQLVRHGEHAVSAYSRLLNDLSAAGSELEKSIIVKVERQIGSKKVVETIKLMSDQKIEARVKRVYGEDARVLSTEVRTEGEMLVRSKSVRACIASAYAVRAASKAAKHFDAELRSDPKMNTYINVLTSHGFSDMSALDNDDDKYFMIMEALAKAGLAAKAKEGYVLEEGLAEHVEERRRHLRGETARLASDDLALDLFRYYVSTPSRKREGEPLFPGLAASLSLKQVRMFSTLSKELGVKDAGSLLLEKLDAERLSAGIKGDLFGAALFSLRSKKPLAWCAEFFGVGDEELKEAREKVHALLGGTDRSRKFMELVKGARNKRKQ